MPWVPDLTRTTLIRFRRGRRQGCLGKVGRRTGCAGHCRWEGSKLRFRLNGELMLVSRINLRLFIHFRGAFTLSCCSQSFFFFFFFFKIADCVQACSSSGKRCDQESGVATWGSWTGQGNNPSGQGVLWTRRHVWSSGKNGDAQKLRKQRETNRLSHRSFSLILSNGWNNLSFSGILGRHEHCWTVQNSRSGCFTCIGTT